MKAIWSVFVGLAMCGMLIADEGKDGPVINVGAEGSLAFVVAYDGNTNYISSCAQKIASSLLVNCEVKTGRWTMATAQEAYKKANDNVAVFIVSDPSLPLSLLALESKWAVVNANGLTDSQLQKEMQRVVTMFFSVKYSASPSASLKPAFSVQELERVGNSISFDSLMIVFQNLKSYGIKQYKTMSYRSACYKGLEPEPKTDVEKSIRAQVRAELGNEK